MNMHFWFAAILLVCMIYARMQVLAIRGWIPVQTPPFMQKGANYSFWPIVVWGLVALEWWYPLLVAFVWLAACALIVHPRFFVFWYKSAGLLESATVAGTLWLWLPHWPF